MPDKPRSFKEVVAAQTPAEQARLAIAEAFKDVLVRNPFQQNVTVIEDRDGTGEWRVEYFDDDGACYVTVFSGPQAERRARIISTPSSLDGCEPSERRDRRSFAPAHMPLPPRFRPAMPADQGAVDRRPARRGCTRSSTTASARSPASRRERSPLQPPRQRLTYRSH